MARHADEPYQPYRPPWLVPGLAGLFLGILASGVAGVFVTCGAYRFGHRRGRAAARERLHAMERAIAPAPAARAPAIAVDVADATSLDGATPGAAGSDQSWCFLPMETVRLTWPAEIVSGESGSPFIRIREGANRLAIPGGAVAEYAFRTEESGSYTVYVRCNVPDECGNSLYCSIDGSRRSVVGDSDTYGAWHWVRSFRRFRLGSGLHRLTLRSREDGARFDRVVITRGQLPAAALEKIAPTAAPTFTRLPVAADTLPAIGAVSCAAFPAKSVVIGAGHDNALSLYARANDGQPHTCDVQLRSERGRLHLRHTVELTADTPSRLVTWPLKLQPGDLYLVPLRVDVFVDGTRVYSREIRFCRPLAWAFLGPFDDPERKGLDLHLPPDDRVGELHRLPEIDGRRWMVVQDGSCYGELGEIDLNKVFGFANRPRHLGKKITRPMIAYAVTTISCPAYINHTGLAYGGDDALQVWQNGHKLLRVDSNLPLELSRQVVGTELFPGRNLFVFKIPQTESYWRFLFEVDKLMTGGDRDVISALPESIQGIGITYQPSRFGLLVRSIIDNGPADRDGRLKVGDVITAAAERDGEFTPMRGLREDQIASHISGDLGSVIRLKVLRPKAQAPGRPQIIELRRGKIHTWGPETPQRGS